MGRYLRAEDGWEEILRTEDGEVAIVQSNAGFLKPVAVFEDGYYFTLDSDEMMVRPGAEETPLDVAQKMLGVSHDCCE